MTPDPKDTQSVQHCWNEIGDWGRHSCPELEKWTHCRNCPVYCEAGQGLFQQPPPAEYLQEWTQFLASERAGQLKQETSAMIFRLAEEWLALETDLFREVAEKRTVHRIPHRTNKVLLGLVNLRGGLQLCISLRELLGIADTEGRKSSLTREARERLVVVERQGVSWVFPVDEIYGIHRFSADESEPVPVTVAKAARSFTKGIITVQDRKVGCLDDELVFYHLQRSVL